MAKIEQKTTFKAGNREFDTKEDAERYEMIRVATEEFDRATREYNVALAKTCKTADGYPFQLGQEYYIVIEGLHVDGIKQEYLYPRDVKFFIEGKRNAILFKGPRNDDKVVEINLKDIYKKERNAKLRLLEARRQRLEWAKKDVELLEKELGIEAAALSVNVT